jgi:hypothetical protein
MACVPCRQTVAQLDSIQNMVAIRRRQRGKDKEIESRLVIKEQQSNKQNTQDNMHTHCFNKSLRDKAGLLGEDAVRSTTFFWRQDQLRTFICHLVCCWLQSP